MSLSKKYNVSKEFESLLNFKSEDEKLENDRTMLSLSFISVIQQHMEKHSLTKKQLASATGVSASFITQLFRGDKLVSMEILAKFQKALDVNFCISTTNINEMAEQWLNFQQELLKVISESAKLLAHEIPNNLSIEGIEVKDYTSKKTQTNYTRNDNVIYLPIAA
jgi:transcriptional regulator with XRE-family HTH domain